MDIQPTNIQPTDNEAHRFPVSVKGVVLADERVVLVHNVRGEWELPGGKLEPGESPEECVARELAEELGLGVSVGPLLDTWMYHIADGVDVLIVTYGCEVLAAVAPVAEAEACVLGMFHPDQIDALAMPAGYKRSIAAWLAHRVASTAASR